MKKLLLLVAALLCASCAGVAPLTDAEAIACRNEGCAAFTEQELLQIMGRAYKEGYLDGWKDFGKQSGRTM